MYRYEYERLSIDFSGWGPLGGNEYRSEMHRQIIDRRAKQGWRYVGYIPAAQRGTGHVSEIDLVFEKQE